MRLSCGTPKATMSNDLLTKLALLGVEPIITNIVVRVVYEGDDLELGKQILAIFKAEIDHDETVFWDNPHEEQKQARQERKADRQQKRKKKKGCRTV